MAEGKVTDKALILRDFARWLGKKTKVCNCYDANVCSYSVDRESLWKPIIQSGQPFVEELRAEYLGHRIHLMANLEILSCTLKGGFDIGVCSINQPNRVYPVTLVQWTVGNILPVFISQVESPEAQAAQLFLSRSDVYDIVCQTIASDSDSLHFFEGSVTFYCMPGSTEDLRIALDSLAKLAAFFAPGVDKWRLDSLPHSLRDLSELIQKWAVADDAERSDLQKESPASELNQLVMAVDAHREEIARYRSSAGESDEASIALSTLEESAEEVRLILKSK
jgi:hypothetical protein